MMTTWRLTLGILSMAALSASTAAANNDCRAASPDYTVALVELYTSEGCDSCPPADRWFSGLDLGSSPPRAAAVAFHVDYWDRLGWRDRFDSPVFTQRQNEQLRHQDGTFVYTPQILLQGHDFATWRGTSQPSRALALINSRPARASIELAATPTAAAAIAVDVHVRVPQAEDRAHVVVSLALVQSDLVSEVKAGENAGKRLKHDHVVRAWRSGLAVDAGGELKQRVELPLPNDSGKLEVVAWAQDDGSGNVLQALSLPLCDH